MTGGNRWHAKAHDILKPEIPGGLLWLGPDTTFIHRTQIGVAMRLLGDAGCRMRVRLLRSGNHFSISEA